MAEAANVVDFSRYQEDRFYEETGLPPETFTTDREELGRRISLLDLRTQVGCLIRDTELPGDRIIEGIIEELMGAALERMTIQEMEESLQIHTKSMMDWLKSKI
jgi:hypothetical protein